MPLTAPVLDDRRYADIVRDAKSLIPRYTPEWTDHNPSDPGITLIELYAWMTDMLLYRVNQVPERNYVKFLQLLGVERCPAAPARAELTFTLARPDLDHVIVPSGTRVAVSGGGAAGGAPIVFETDEALIALGASLVALQSFDGVGHRRGAGQAGRREIESGREAQCCVSRSLISRSSSSRMMVSAS